MAKTPLNVRVDPTLLRKIRQKAAAENRTVSNLVDTALRQYVDKTMTTDAKNPFATSPP